jgi:flagellin-like hook-associated protein FlgL
VAGKYNFDANGAPAVGNNGLAYQANDVKKQQVVNVVQVNDTWPGGTAPGQYNFDATGAPAVGGNGLAYQAGDVKKAASSTTTRVGENDVTTYSINNVTVGENRYSIANVQEVTATVYNGENIVTEQYSTGFTPNTETVAKNWTKYENRVDFGSNFTISEFANQANDNLNQGNGTVDTAPRVEYSVPTPTEAQMALPTYADYQGRVAANDVKGNDDTAVASTARAMNVALDTVDGNLKLDTGEFDFSKGFGIFHGPAAVSDEFTADQGDFLKLDYSATGVNDDYHVAGYIYEVNPDGSPKSAPIIALNETGKSVTSRASVEVPETGTYRFVFIVGTHDLTGGKLAGADMTIDNIVAEEPYTISTGAVSDVLKAIHFENNANAANPNKTLVTKVSNQDGTTVLTDDALINMQNFALTSEPDGPYMLAPTLDFTTQPSEGGTGSAVVLTKKIEVVQDRINLARTQAGSQYGTLEEAINITTDLRSQFALGSGTLSDLNFSIETVNLTRRQMQQDVATTVLAQANKAQSSLVTLVDGSYRSYLNS